MATTRSAPAKRTRTINISPPERVARVVLGGLATAVGVVIVAGGPGVWALVGALLLAAAGLDFVVTGATGYCPLYARLGHVPRSLRSRPR